MGGTKEEEDKHNSPKPHFPGRGLTAHSQLLLITNRIVEKCKTNENFWEIFFFNFRDQFLHVSYDIYFSSSLLH